MHCACMLYSTRHFPVVRLMGVTPTLSEAMVVAEPQWPDQCRPQPHGPSEGLILST